MVGQNESGERGDKLKISISISKYLKNRMDELVDKGEFASVSEIISIAITKFLTEYELKNREKDVKEILKLIEEGKLKPDRIHKLGEEIVR